MSTQDQVHADIRYTSEKLPAHLGENPSEETIKDWFSSFGYVRMYHITNNSGDTVKFYNPASDVGGDIAPGQTENHKTQGYLPYWRNEKRYQITYFNQAFNAWKTINIKDLEGHWWVSLDHDGDDEDIRTIHPKPSAAINININGNGYEIYNAESVTLIGRFSFHK